MASPSSTAPQLTGLLSQVKQWIDGGLAKGWQSFHTSSPWDSNEKGQDIGVPLNTPLAGITGTTVRSIQPTWAGSSGGLISLVDDFGNIFNIGHVTPVRGLTVGMRTQSDQVIAYSAGLPGPNSSSPHVEFQVQPSGSSDTVDPIAWLSGTPRTSGSGGQGDAITDPMTGLVVGFTGQDTGATPPSSIPVSPGAEASSSLSLTNSNFKCPPDQPTNNNTPVWGGLINAVQNAVYVMQYAMCAISATWRTLTQPGYWWRALFVLVGLGLVVLGLIAFWNAEEGKIKGTVGA